MFSGKDISSGKVVVFGFVIVFLIPNTSMFCIEHFFRGRIYPWNTFVKDITYPLSCVALFARQNIKEKYLKRRNEHDTSMFYIRVLHYRNIGV
jgi:hypothetical protein